jgi:hypothetical protein
MAPGGDAEEDHLADALGMRLGVGERKRAAPRSTEDEPALDLEVLAQPLDVRDQVRGGVVRQVDAGRAGMWRASPAVALVQERDPVDARVEQLAVPRRAARPRPAVQDDRRLALGVATELPVDAIAATDIE